MDKKFEHLIVKNPILWPVGRALDYEKVNKLSDTEFSEFYLSMMREYKEIDGWWSGDKIPKCSVCHSVIPGPEMLRRLSGRSLDPDHFREVYGKERETYEPIMQAYWDRVAKLDLTVKP